jgi:murein DD-endopeptidase MepM/ murein hydrolase activator NlpD
MKPTMSILLLTSDIAEVRSFAVNPRRATLLALITVIALCGGILSSGFHLGITTEARRQLAEVTALQTLYHQQQADIARVRETARTSLDVLTLRLGRMQAQLSRLDALGAQLVTQADLDATEFDFNNPPSVGGPHDASAASTTTVADFLGMLDELDITAADREDKVATLKQLLMHRNLRARITPSGRAVEHGLLSSEFGRRIDPFTGKWEQHKGIDIAGKEGTDVMALGDGVVIWSGERPGYGNLVEIDHGRGYITRYGHNKKLLVMAGDTVRKGQTIALMGSTGRSTGPHVHIEVVQNGEQVDPAKYLNN